jgi:acyl-CoA thioesterase II
MAIPYFELNAGDQPDRFTWEPPPALGLPNGLIQGGAVMGAALTALERATERPAVWASAQFLAVAAGDDPMGLEVTILASGRSSTQALCVVSRADNDTVSVRAAFGRRDSQGDGVWRKPPEVPDPDGCERYRYFEPGQGHLGDLVEIRIASGRQRDVIGNGGGRGDGLLCLWIRCWDGVQPVTIADLAFIGDFLPLGFPEATGELSIGNSLDNTIRAGHLVPTEWVLLAVHVDQIAHGFGHGHGHLWAQDGTLLGIVSQTSVLRPPRDQ